MNVRRQYLDGPFGQVHIHIWGNIEKAKNILISLPPSPYSGRAYDTIAPVLTGNNCVIAVDYPRFEGRRKPSIQDYAQVTTSVIKEFRGQSHLSLLGFHTGCLVAVETSLSNQDVLSKIILIDVPYFSPKKQAELKTMSPGVIRITNDLTNLKPAWDRSISRQQGLVSMNRSFEMFVDHLSAGESAGEPFEAAFSYDCESAFSRVTIPSYVIATNAGLYDETLLAARAIKHSTLIEELAIKKSVLEQSASLTAELIKKCVED